MLQKTKEIIEKKLGIFMESINIRDGYENYVCFAYGKKYIPEILILQGGKGDGNHITISYNGISLDFDTHIEIVHLFQKENFKGKLEIQNGSVKVFEQVFGNEAKKTKEIEDNLYFIMNYYNRSLNELFRSKNPILLKTYHEKGFVSVLDSETKKVVATFNNPDKREIFKTILASENK